MAIRPVTSVNVDTHDLTMLAVSSKPKVDGDGVQKYDVATGLAQYVIEALVTDSQGKVGSISVTVPSATDVDVALTPIRFEGLVATQYAIANEGSGFNAGLAFKADAFSVKGSKKATTAE